MISNSFLILIVTILVCWVGCYEASPLKHLENEMEISNNCRNLCSHCGCAGFYCGDECICDCNRDDIDVKCVETMQSNCQKLKLPFEVLIQGPSGNQFVRKLVIEAETSMPMQDLTLIRRARSTVSIYQPDEKSSDVRSGVSVPASEVTNQAVVPVATESKPKQSVVVASVSEQTTTKATFTERTNAESKVSTTEATTPATQKIVTEPKTAMPDKETKKTEHDAPLRQKRQDEVVASETAPAAAPAAVPDVVPAAVPANVPAAVPAVEAAADVTEKPDEGPDVGGPRVGLPLLPLPLFPFGQLPVLGAVKPALGLAAIKAEAAKNIALIKANLGAAKIGTIGGPLAAAKAAATVQLAALKAKLPILPAII